MPETDPRSLSSKQLIDLWREGDRAAADALWERYAQDLLKFIRAHRWQTGKRSSDSQSLLNSLFADVLRTLIHRPDQSFSDDRHVFHWMRQLAKWKLAKRHRKRSEESFDPQVAEVISRPPRQEHIEMFSRLIDYIATLSERDQQVFDLALTGFSEEGKHCTQQEIGRRLGISERHVRRILAAARKRLELE